MRLRAPVLDELVFVGGCTTGLLKRPEGKTLEFKRDLSSPDGVLRSPAATAFQSLMRVVQMA